MKQTFFRNLGVFIIITMFCLAPLGAVDLDDDNNKYINQEDNESIASEDAITVDNETIAIDNSIDIDNVTKEIDNDIETIADEKNKSLNASEVSDRVYPPMAITVKDSYEGQAVVVEVRSYDFINEPLDIRTAGHYEYVWMENGYASVKIYGIKAGSYTASVFNEATLQKNETTYKVIKAPGKTDPKLDIQIDHITEGQKAVVNIGAADNVNGEAYIKLNHSDTVYPFNIVNGSATVTIDEDLAPGNYLATVTYSGDETFKASESFTTFKVNKAPELIDPNLEIKVDDITEGQKAVVAVSANETVNGKANIKLNHSDTVYPVNIVNGYAKVTIDEDLAPGNYLATVTYSGDETFKASESSTTFKVKSDPKLEIKVGDVPVGDKATAEIHTASSFTGHVLVYLEGSVFPYAVSVINGHGKVTFKDSLPVGTYNVTVKYAGDGKFSSSEASTTFNVKENVPELIDPNLSIKVDDITEGQKAVVAVSANETVNGEANIKLNHSDTVYPVDIVNGSATVSIDEDLAPGDYLATVSYSGDDTFKATEVSTSFKVNKKELIDPKLDIKVGNITYGDKATVTVSTDDEFTGNVDVEIGTKNYVVKVVKGKGTTSVSGLKVGTYTAKATFKETDVYKASTKTTQFTVNKVTPKLIAENKYFNYFQKTKSYSVSLLDNKGKAIKGQKVILKVNGKTYSATTNAKGIATFKITNLNKIGCSNAVINYAGDNTYNTVSKQVKLIVSLL